MKRSAGLFRCFERFRRRSLRRNEDGVTIIEFALVGPIFFLLIGATIETALVFFASATLDNAVLESSRLLRTGQSEYIDSQSNYRDALCGHLYGIFNCNELRVSVRTLSDFNSFTTTDPIDPNTGAWTISNNFPASGSVAGSQVMMVEAYYKWPTFFNIPNLNIGQTADGKRLLASAHIYQNEPF